MAGPWRNTATSGPLEISEFFVLLLLGATPSMLRGKAMGAKGVAVLAITVLLGLAVQQADAAETQAQRGKYLVSIIPCTDCHTPGTFLGKPDMKRFLSGSEVGFEIPGLGIFYGPNLTPDDETGLGKWTREQIATAITTGKRPDGRILAPAMPVDSFKHLTREDALAIATYLKTLPAINHKVPGPFGPNQKPTSFVY